jgi:hypothetical protein
MAKHRFIAVELLLALFIAGSLAFAGKVSVTGLNGDVWPANFMAPIGVQDLLAFAGLFVACALLLVALRQLLTELTPKAKTPSEQTIPTLEPEPGFHAWARLHWRQGAIMLVGVFLCWLVIFLNYFPGTSMNDQLAVIAKPIDFAASQPLFYNLILSGFVRLGQLLTGSGSAGMAAYVLVQMLLLSACIAINALWLTWRKAPRTVTYLVVILFAITPLFSNYAISTLKDTLFAYVMLGWVPYLFEAAAAPSVFWRKRSSYVWLGVLLAAIMLLRNNGIYIALFVAIALLIAYGARAYRRILIATLLAIIVGLMPNIVLTITGTQQLFREAVGIPLQQIAAVVVADGAGIEEEDLDFVGNIMPIERIKEVYAPMSVDNLKYDPAFNNAFLNTHQLEFMYHYLRIGVAHPELYTRAWLSATYGFWSITAGTGEQATLFAISGNLREPSDEATMREFGLANTSVYPEPLQRLFSDGYEHSMWFPGAGVCYLAVLLAVFALSVMRGKPRWLLLATPFVALWITCMLATPIAFGFRYALPLAVALPLLIAALFIPCDARLKAARRTRGRKRAGKPRAK